MKDSHEHDLYFQFRSKESGELYSSKVDLEMYQEMHEEAETDKDFFEWIGDLFGLDSETDWMEEPQGGLVGLFEVHVQSDRMPMFVHQAEDLECRVFEIHKSKKL